jgi:enoyl-CoA hydratase
MPDDRGHLWDVHFDDGIVVAKFADPPANYFTDRAVRELTSHVDRWNSPEIRAIVLTGANRGGLVTHFHPEEIISSVRDTAGLITRGPVRNTEVNRMLNALGELSAPVVIALSGDTMGFGFELALACDFRIGEDGDYLYGLPEVRLGVIPGSGGIARLSRLVGLGLAADLVLRGRVVSPREALNLGLITEVAADSSERALSLARELKDLPQLAVALAKRAMREGSEVPLAAALTIGSEASVRAKLGPDVADALESYLSMNLAERRRWLRGLR